MTIQEVTEALAQTEITEKPYELPILDKNSASDLLEQDSKVCELLELLDEYEKVANDNWRLEFVNGFLDLSRANYNGSRKFGIDALDLRPYSACAVVEEVKGNFRLVDRLALQNEQRRKERERKKSEETLQEKKDLTSESGEKSVDQDDSDSDQPLNEKSTSVQPTTTDAGLRNRGSKPKSKTAALKVVLEEKNSPKPASVKEVPSKSSFPYKDPINQFGGLVPYQLRSSQTQFAKGLATSVRMVNLQRRISLLVQDIEAQM